jgi:hypothetical protein
MKKLLVVFGACALLGYGSAPAHADYALYSWSGSGSSYGSYSGPPGGPYPPAPVTPGPLTPIPATPAGTESWSFTGLRGPASITTQQEYTADTTFEGYITGGKGFTSSNQSTWAAQGAPTSFEENLQQTALATVSISGSGMYQLAIAELAELVSAGPASTLASGTSHGEWNMYSQAANTNGRMFGKWVDLGTMNWAKSTSTPTAGAAFVTFSNSSVAGVSGRSSSPSRIEAMLANLASAQITTP